MTDNMIHYPYAQIVTDYFLAQMNCIPAFSGKCTSKTLSKVSESSAPYGDYFSFEEIQQQIVLQGTPEFLIPKLTRDCFGNLHFLSQILSLLSHPLVSDIIVTDHSLVRFKKGGQVYTAIGNFKTRDQYLTFIDYLQTRNHLLYSERNRSTRFCDNTLSEKDLLFIDIHTSSLEGNGEPILIIHRDLRRKKAPDELVRSGMISKEDLPILLSQIILGPCILFTGTDRKTCFSLMNTFMEEIPLTSDILVVQKQQGPLFGTHPGILVRETKTTVFGTESRKELFDTFLPGHWDYFISDSLEESMIPLFRKVLRAGKHVWVYVPGETPENAMSLITNRLHPSCFITCSHQGVNISAKRGALSRKER